MVQSMSTAQHSTAQHSTAQHADYDVIGRLFCQPLKQTFSHLCEEVFSVSSELEVTYA